MRVESPVQLEDLRTTGIVVYSRKDERGIFHIISADSLFYTHVSYRGRLLGDLVEYSDIIDGCKPKEGTVVRFLFNAQRAILWIPEDEIPQK